jgi:tRNA-dihydrouridine synthase B
VVSKGGGSALCRDLPNLSKLLTAMVKSVKIPVTIKIRTGWDANSRNCAEVAQVAADAGVAWVAIHGRTRAQGYSGLADWDMIGDVKAKARLPIIGNGDINTPETAVERVQTYGVDAVLIGRGALRNPFLFEQAQALWEGRPYAVPTAQDYITLMEQQREFLGADYPERSAMIHARKFLAWYSAGFPGCHEFRRMLFSEPNAEVIWSEARRFFLEKTERRDLAFMREGFLMGGHG